MKRLVLFLLLCTSYAGAVAFVAATSGDWQATATWGTSGTGCHVAFPCITDASNPGDTVSMNGKTVTCSTGETCSFGVSPSSTTLTACSIAGGASMDATVNGSHLIVQNGANFVVGGPVCFASFSTVGQIIEFLDGAHIYHDSSWATTPIGYTWWDTYSANSTGQWLIGTSSGSGAILDGDSFDAPTRNPSGCTAALTTGCMSGQWGGQAGQNLEGGILQAYNSTFKGMGGSSNFWSLYVLNRVDANFIHNRVFYCGAFSWDVRGTKNLNFKGNFITAALSHFGIFNRSFISSSGGLANITDNYVETGGIGYQPQAASITGTLVMNNVQKLPWSAGVTYTAGSANRTGSNNPSHYITAYQMLYYNDSWAFGASEGATYMYENSANLQDSIMWLPRNFGGPPSSQHLHSFGHTSSNGTNGAWIVANNIVGSFGDYSNTDYNYQMGNATGGTPNGTGMTLVFTGNIEVCGWVGTASATGMGHWYSAASSNWPSQSISNYQNTNCASLDGITSNSLANSGGYAGAEYPGPGAWGAPDSINMNANLQMRMDGPGVGDVPIIGSYSGVSDSFFQANPPWHSVNYNAFVNMKAADAGIPPCVIRTGTQAINSCLWITSGGAPTTATEIMIPNFIPIGVDFTRTFIHFGEYLNATGLLPYSYYTTGYTVDLGYTTLTAKLSSVGGGAWTTGTAYAVGDIVYVDRTVTGYANVWNGRRSYWICKIAHTASNLNRPIIGSDSSNVFAGPTPYWESAWLTAWLKPNVIAGTVYGDNTNGSTCTADAVTGVKVCNDGALASLYTEAGNTGHKLYAIGLLNTWIRQGYISMMPATWGAKQGTTGCSRDGGVTFIECGAMPLPMIRHIPPHVMVN